MISATSTRRFWETRAARLAARINLAAWLGALAPVIFFLTTATAVAVFALRRLEQPVAWAWLGLAAALAVATVACWWRVRRAFFRPADARVLLEATLRLDTRLTAASLGLVPWPAEPVEWPAIVRWRLRAPAGWIGAAAAVLALALFAPVPRDTRVARPTGSPPALLQTEAMLTALQETNVAEPRAVEQLAERARELARRSSDEQYSHSGLEAADALRSQTVVAATRLARELESAATALHGASTGADANSTASKLSAALSGLREGDLPANSDLLSGLPNSLADLKGLSSAQLAQLAQQFSSAAGKVGGVCGAAGAGAPVAQPDPDAVGQVGAGGEGGGGVSAPLALNSDASDAGKGRSEGLSAEALKRVALGDKLGTSTGAHEVDPAKTVDTGAAGAVAAPAAGGEAAWVNRLTPTERAAVKKFFQ